MMRTFEALIEEDGTIRLLESVPAARGCRALVTILDDQPEPAISEAALLGEAALATDWNRPEEDIAWSHLPRER